MKGIYQRLPGMDWIKAGRPNNYRIGSYLLISFAALLLMVALFANIWEFTHYILIMVGSTCFIGGVLLFVLGRDEPVNVKFIGRLSTQGISTLGQIIRDQNNHGTALFLPADSREGRVMQSVTAPVSPEIPASEGNGFVYCNGGSRTLITPLASPLLDDLKHDYGLTLPSDYSLLMRAIKELCEETLSITDRMDIRREGDRVILTLHNYLLYSGCASLHATSPGLCTLCPCSICSLIACMIAEGLGCEVSLNRTVLDDTDRSLRVELSCAFAKDTPLPAYGYPWREESTRHQSPASSPDQWG